MTFRGEEGIAARGTINYIIKVGLDCELNILFMDNRCIDIFLWHTLKIGSYCTIQLLLIIRINIYYSKLGINKTHDPIISFVLWHCCIFHALRETEYSSNSTGEKKRTGVLGGMCKTMYWQSFSNSYPITRPLSLSALWKNPSEQQKQKWYYFANSERISLHICMFALNGGTTTPVLPVCQVWGTLKVKNLGS